MKKILTIDLDNIENVEFKKGTVEDIFRWKCFDVLVDELLYLSNCPIKEDVFDIIGVAIDTIVWLRRTRFSDHKIKELLLLYMLKDIKRNVEKQLENE